MGFNNSIELAKENNQLKRLLALIVEEYGEANNDWSVATIKLPSEQCMSLDPAPELAIHQKVDTMEWCVSVFLKEKPKTDPPARVTKPVEPEPTGYRTSYCKYCLESIYKTNRSADWKHHRYSRPQCKGGLGIATPKSE